MRTSSLLEILNSFSGEELEKFSFFLNSPYHNKSEKLINFYKLILEQDLRFSNVNLSYKEIYEKLYPGRNFKPSTIGNLIFDLQAAALKFLEHESLQNDRYAKKKYLLKELNKKSLTTLSKKIIKKTENCSLDGVDYNYFSFRQYLESYKFNTSYIHSKISGSGKLKFELRPVENSAEYLLYYYICELCSFFVNSRIYEMNYNIIAGELLPEKLLNELSLDKIKKIIPASSKFRYIINLYESLVRLYSNIEKEKLYFTYRANFEKYNNYLSSDEKNMHMNYLISYCIYKKDQSGEFASNGELFDLYVLMLEKEYYKDSKTEYLPHELYRSILLEALRIKKYDWAWQFSEIYSAKLRPADRKNMKNLAMAYISFETGALSDSLKHINKINLDFFIFKIDVKNLMLRIFYELGNTEAAFDLIKSYKEYLRKNNLLNKEKKARYLSFVRFTEKLLKYSETRDKSELGYIKYRLSNHKSTAFKPWLTEKIMQLEQGYKFTA